MRASRCGPVRAPRLLLFQLRDAWLAACLASCLAGCASLPVFVPDLLRRTPDHSVQITGASGPLTAAQSQVVLDRLSDARVTAGATDTARVTDSFERQLALEQALVGSPLVTGNDVRLLEDGPATYDAMFAAIRAARDHINMETYILDDDDMGQRFAQALIAKQRQGVQVNLMHDSVGTLGTPAAFFKNLTDNGIKVLEFNPVNPLATRKEWALNQRDHRKLLIVDGATAFLGGINISSVYSGGSTGHRSSRRLAQRDADRVSWRDTDLQLTGPVVAEFQKLFLAAWAAQGGAPLTPARYFPLPQVAGRQVVRAIGSSPDEEYSAIYLTLLFAISNAQRSIRLTNAYFVPDPQLLGALEAAAQRGVDVTLVLPGQTDSWLVFHAGRSSYERLLRAGVKIYERRGVILHSKTALIDDVWATVGSTNLDWRSFLHNHELNAVVLGVEFGAQLQAMFANDLAASDAVTLETWRRRSLDLRIKEWFARAWEYWL